MRQLRHQRAQRQNQRFMWAIMALAALLLCVLILFTDMVFPAE